MNEILFSLLLWIGDNTQYDIFLTQPNISQVEPANLCRQYTLGNNQQCKPGQITGFYNKLDTIYLGLDFKADTLDQKSQLLHELVHYVQWQNMFTNEPYCLGQIEHEAYRLQNLWRKQNKLQPVSDEFTLMMLAASCES